MGEGEQIFLPSLNPMGSGFARASFFASAGVARIGCLAEEMSSTQGGVGSAQPRPPRLDGFVLDFQVPHPVLSLTSLWLVLAEFGLGEGEQISYPRSARWDPASLGLVSLPPAGVRFCDA